MLGSKIFGAIFSIDARSLKVHSATLKHLNCINNLVETSNSSKSIERIKKIKRRL